MDELNTGKVLVAFRLDDPSSVSDHAIETKILELFASHGIPLTVAVIPFGQRNNISVPVDRGNVPHLMDFLSGGHIEIAVHGYAHQGPRRTARGGRTEFAGVAMTVQRKMLEAAKNQIGELTGQVTGFVPPFNTYDRNTVDAAADLGFSYLSGGCVDIERSNRLQILPATCNLRNVRTALTEALCLQSLTPTVIANFHPDEFEEYRAAPLPGEPGPFTNLAELKSLLRACANDNRLKCTTISELVRRDESASGYRHCSELSTLRVLPWRLRAHLPKHALFAPGIRSTSRLISYVWARRSLATLSIPS